MQAVIGMLLLSAVAHAGEVIDSSVTLDDGVYALNVAARINAPPERVLQFITDYEQLPLLNPSIRKSDILRTYSPVKHRVRTVIRVCILFFCRTVLQVQDIEQLSNTRITASIVPELSEFSYGRAEWVLNRSGQETLMHFAAELEPAFWVPPVIGPWLFKRKVVSELLESVAYMEANTMPLDAP